MTTNGSVPADDLVSKLKIAASDDQGFRGMVNFQRSIVTATNPNSAKSYDDMFAVYMKAAQEIVIKREANPTSSSVRSVNASCSFCSRTSIPRSKVASNPFIDWMVHYSQVDSSFDDGDLDIVLDEDDDDFLNELAYLAYTATCHRCNVDPTVSIPGHAFKKIPSEFCSVWSRQSEKDKAMLIRSIADRAHPDDIDTIPADAPPWKRAAARPPQRKKTPYSANTASTASPTTIVNFLEANKLRSY